MLNKRKLAECDRLWGKVIHQDGGGKCAFSHISSEIVDRCAGKLEAAHIISRAHLTTRHVRINGLLLCEWHHRGSQVCSSHKSPKKFMEVLKAFFPGRFEYVQRYKHVITQHKDYPIDEILDNLRRCNHEED